MAAFRTHSTYDHRLRELVRTTGDVGLATRLGVPRSTAAGWLRCARRPVVSVPDVPQAEADLHAEVARLRRRLHRLSAIVYVLLVLVRTFRLDLTRRRVHQAKGKLRLLRAIDRARGILPLHRILRLTRLSPARYHAWRRVQEPCQLEDQVSCPKTSPHQLTPEEIRRMSAMVASPAYRHVPTATLARLAQRLGRVFASASTWHRLVRARGWRRPRAHIHPERPRVGIRATKPSEIWHIDTTSSASSTAPAPTSTPSSTTSPAGSWPGGSPNGPTPPTPSPSSSRPAAPYRIRPPSSRTRASRIATAMSMPSSPPACSAASSP